MEVNSIGPVSAVRRRSISKRVTFKLDEDAQSSEGQAESEQSSSVLQKLSRDPIILALTYLLFVLALVGFTLSRFEVRPVQPHITSVETEFKSNPKLDVVLSGSNNVTRTVAQTHSLFWKVTAGQRRPDGVLKRVYLINDDFPGPLIEANVGDTLDITVENGIDQDGEGLAVHWHGLHNRGSNEMDGTVGFTQCPIMPGKNFTYVIELTQAGSFWYHSHDQVQRADGMYGGLVVHGADPVTGLSEFVKGNYYDEERLLLVGDWYHRSAKDVLGWYLRAASFGNEPVPDSLLINGLGAYDCAKGVPARPVDCDPSSRMNPPVLKIDFSKRYRFRVVNVGTLAGITVKLPGSEMRPIEVDGGASVVGETASSVGILYPGERVDLLVSFPNALASDDHHLEVELENENFKYPNPALTRKHRFPLLPLNYGFPRYASSSKSKPAEKFDLVVMNSTGRPTGMPAEADMTFVLYTTTLKLAKSHNIPEGFINQTSWSAQKQPLITVPRSQWNQNQLVPFIPYNKDSPKWVDIVLNNLDDGSHPFHLHSYDFYVLSGCADGTYWGSYNPFDPSEEPPCGAYNLLNPIRKDTVYVPKRGYVVLRFRADNPGIHMFHCHILWHQASGMAMGFHVGDEEEANVSQSWPAERLQNVLQTCE